MQEHDWSMKAWRTFSDHFVNLGLRTTTMICSMGRQCIRNSLLGCEALRKRTNAMRRRGENWPRLAPMMMARLPRRPQTYLRNSAVAVMTSRSFENDGLQWLLPQHLAMEEQAAAFVGGPRHPLAISTALELLQLAVQILQIAWWTSTQKKAGDAVLKFWHC